MKRRRRNNQQSRTDQINPNIFDDISQAEFPALGKNTV